VVGQFVGADLYEVVEPHGVTRADRNVFGAAAAEDIGNDCTSLLCCAGIVAIASLYQRALRRECFEQIVKIAADRPVFSCLFSMA
jgi:hypothetical protein